MLLDWVDMVCWKQFNCYFDHQDIIELSLLSKCWRLKLMPLVFKKIGYKGIPNRIVFNQSFYKKSKKNNYQDENDINLMSDDEKASNDHSIDSEEFFGDENPWCSCYKTLEGIHDYGCCFQVNKTNTKIRNETKIIHGYVKQLKVFELLDDFHFQHPYHTQFIGLFSNLTHLDLNYTRFHLYQLENIFKESSKLKYLALREVVIIEGSAEYQEVVSLEFPKSINTLYIKKGINYYPEDGYHDYLDYFQLLEDDDFYFPFQPHHLPNLKRLTYINGVDIFDTIMVDFLKLNPQLKYLSSSENAFTLPLLTQISTHSSLKQIAIIKEPYIYPQQFDSNPSTLGSIEYLEISFGKFNNGDFFKKIILSCSNISHLHLKNDDNWKESAEILAPVINKLTGLYTLSITGFPVPMQFIPDMTKNSSVKKLNLTEINLYFLDLTLIEKLCNIDYVHISYKTSVYPKSQMELNALIEKYQNWRILIFNNSANCHRTSN